MTDFILLGSKITVDCDFRSDENKRHLLLGGKVETNLDRIFKSRDITLPTKVHIAKAMVFSSSHVWIWELDCKKGWAPKNWCFWIVLEKTLENPLDSKIKPFNLQGNQPWIFIARTDAEAPILWPPDAKSQLTVKDPDAGKDWEQEEKGMTEDEMVGRHQWLKGHEFEHTLGDGEGRASGEAWPCPCTTDPGFSKSRHKWVTEQQQELRSNWMRCQRG